MAQSDPRVVSYRGKELSHLRRESEGEAALSSSMMQSEPDTTPPVPDREPAEWVPPISALGGPPAHVLYNELVMYAHLKVYRTSGAEPLLVFLDGESRRSFNCPSPELTGALDRFRMRRGLRPSPAKDVDDFSRIIHARITDPDAHVPLPPPDVPPTTQLDTVAEPAPPAAERGRHKVVAATPAIPGDPWVPLTIPGLSLSFSGGFMHAGRKEPPLPHYVRVLQSLVRRGGWMGTTQDLSTRLGEDETRLTENLIRYRADLAEFGIVVANVQVESGWRLLVVDRAHLDDHS